MGQKTDKKKKMALLAKKKRNQRNVSKGVKNISTKSATDQQDLSSSWSEVGNQCVTANEKIGPQCQILDQEKDVNNLSIDDLRLKIKTEIEQNGEVDKNMDVQIKIEHDVPQYHEMNSDGNLQLEFKVEIASPFEMDATSNSHIVPHQDVFNSFKENSKNEDNSEVYTSLISAGQCNTELKIEFENGSEYTEVPNMDSNEATALGNVETCLEEEINAKLQKELEIKYSNRNYGVIQKANQDFYNDSSKLKNLLTTKKYFDGPVADTNAQNEILGSETNNGLFMTILPIVYTGTKLGHQFSHPEAILPTSHDDTEYYNGHCDDNFQLNSITGNVLSLEQEAYGLLEAKKSIEAEPKKYFCPKCPKFYKFNNSLHRHLRVHDSIEKHAESIIRGLKKKKATLRKKKQANKNKRKGEMTFKSNCFRELKTVENSTKLVEGYTCTCGKKFRRRTRMETCLRSHDMCTDTNSRHPCVTCSKVFKSKEDLSVHRKRLHNRKKFPCKFCPTDYNTRKELFKHLQIHQKLQLTEYKAISEFMNGTKKMRCFMCTKSYTQLPELKFHVMADHKDLYVCRHCKETFSKIVDFANHVRKNHPNVEGHTVLDVLEAFSKLVKAWKCEECEVQFLEPDKLALHQIEKHGPNLNANTQFQCEDCRRVFVSQKGLQSHRRIHHSSEIVEKAAIAEKSIICPECRKVCKDIDTLTSHMRLHSPERKYPCKFCDFRFTTPEKRKAHAEVHTGDMKYVCFICDYQCTSENRLKYHKMTPKHLHMKEYLLTAKSMLETDQTIIKSETVKEDRDDANLNVTKKKKKERDSVSASSFVSDNTEATCDICGDKFSTESEMLDHKETHPFIEIPNEDKPTRIFFK